VFLACEPAEAPAEAPSAVDAGSRPTVEAPRFEDAYLARYDFDDRVWYVDLPGRLDEVSGLAFAHDGRLFAHDDERGRIHEIDPATGAVGKRFDMGEDLVRDDFEGIAIVGDRFFLISSTGTLYETREGADRENMAYRVTDSGVGRSCEVEGLEYDPAGDDLLIACKITLPDRGEIVVHRLPLDPERARPDPLRVPKAALRTVGLDPEFDPSGIAVTPVGTWLLLSGRNDALIEVTPDGEVLYGVELRKGRHPQSEGVAIGPDEMLYISDEKNGKEARLTAYGAR
jgi:uncharacterized protein YjiK